MLVNKICPNCKTEQKGLNLRETNGSFVCSNCRRHFIVEDDIEDDIIKEVTQEQHNKRKESGREVKQEDIVKGFEYEDGKYVIFEDKDFEKLKSMKDKNITIEKFVALTKSLELTQKPKAKKTLQKKTTRKKEA